jgi:hypothetical protein
MSHESVVLYRRTCKIHLKLRTARHGTARPAQPAQPMYSSPIPPFVSAYSCIHPPPLSLVSVSLCLCVSLCLSPRVDTFIYFLASSPALYTHRHMVEYYIHRHRHGRVLYLYT